MSRRPFRRGDRLAAAAAIVADVGLDPVAGTLEMLGFQLQPVHLRAAPAPVRTWVRLVWQKKDAAGVFTVRYTRRLPPK